MRSPTFGFQDRCRPSLGDSNPNYRTGSPAAILVQRIIKLSRVEAEEVLVASSAAEVEGRFRY